MHIFVLKRIFYGLLTALTVVFLMIIIIYLSPLDPARMSFGQRIDTGTLLEKRIAYGLDKPLSEQLIYYLRDISPLWITFDQNYKPKEQYKILLNEPTVYVKSVWFRESFQTGEKVSSIIYKSLPNTIILSILAILFAIVFGVILGYISALYVDTWIDKICQIISIAGYSLPGYVAGMFLAILFGYYLAPFTGLNLQGSLYELDDFGNEIIVLKNLILPTIALGIRPVGLIMQLTRATLIQHTEMEYFKTSLAKGLTFAQAMRLHALPNIKVPVYTAITGWFGSLLAGAFFIENVFNYRGIGLITVNALLNFDIPLALGAILISCIFFVALNILNEILLPSLDPRIKVS